MISAITLTARILSSVSEKRNAAWRPHAPRPGCAQVHIEGVHQIAREMKAPVRIFQVAGGSQIVGL